MHGAGTTPSPSGEHLLEFIGHEVGEPGHARIVVGQICHGLLAHLVCSAVETMNGAGTEERQADEPRHGAVALDLAGVVEVPHALDAPQEDGPAAHQTQADRRL